MGKKLQFTELDQYLFGQGTHYDIYRKLGAHPDTRNRKNDRGENLCQSSKLRKPRRKRTLRRVCHVPFHRRGIFDERDRDGCRIQQ